MIALLLLLTGIALGQSRGDEPQVWTSVGSTMKVAKDLRTGAELGFRSAAEDGDELLTELSLQARHLEFLHITAMYRFALDNWQNVRKKNRFALDLSFRANPGPLKLRFRHRQTLRLAGEDVKFRHVVRWQGKAGFELTDSMTPFFAVEPFFSANPGDPFQIDKFRTTVGTDLDLGRPELSLYYRLEQPVADDNDPRIHILGLALNFGVDFRKK